MNHSTQNNHLIHRLVFEVSMPDQGNNFAFQNVLTNLCKEKIVPVVDAVCSNLAKSSENIVIDTLNIDLKRLAIDNLTETLPNIVKTQILAALTEKIAALKSFNSRRSILHSETRSEWQTTDTERRDDYHTAENRILAVFAYYLSTGILPWWVGSSESQRFITNTIAHFEERPDPFISILRKIIHQNKSVEFGRFISSFTDSCLEKIQAITSGKRKYILPDQKTIADIQMGLSKTGVFYPKRTIYWGIVFSQNVKESFTTQHSGKNMPVLSEISQLLIGDSRLENENIFQEYDDLDTGLETINIDYQKKILARQSEENIYSDISTSDNEDLNFVPEVYTNETEIPVSNSGLVITATFLGMLFKNLSLINKEGFLSHYHRCKAVHLLQYVVVGNHDNQEFQLPLNKILCGMEVSDPIFKVTISKPEEKEVTDLLFSLIKQWSVLKNTSIDGLRTSFLQRPGILEKREHTWRLRVERRSFDLLLERLPWTISLLKLPWMSNPLDVQW